MTERSIDVLDEPFEILAGGKGDRAGGFIPERV